MVEKNYSTDEITVHWNSARCIHTAICLNALPEVFDVRRRPWIEIDAATAEQVAEAVLKCPTGALTFTARHIEEPVAVPTSMLPIRGGPMVVRGDVEIVDRHGDVIGRERRATLCRCGNSANQPYCDNSHRTNGFDEPEPRATKPADAPDEICPPQPGF